MQSASSLGEISHVRMDSGSFSCGRRTQRRESLTVADGSERTRSFGAEGRFSSGNVSMRRIHARGAAVRLSAAGQGEFIKKRSSSTRFNRHLAAHCINSHRRTVTVRNTWWRSTSIEGVASPKRRVYQKWPGARGGFPSRSVRPPNWDHRLLAAVNEGATKKPIPHSSDCN